MIATRAAIAIRSISDVLQFDATNALTLQAACRLGLVPGRGGRRLDPRELERWAIEGVQLRDGGPRYLFPAVFSSGQPMTTPEWCAAWVAFVAQEQRGKITINTSRSRVRQRRGLRIPLERSTI